MRIFVLKWFISYIKKSTGELKDAMDDVSSILNKKGNGMNWVLSSRQSKVENN